MSENDDQTQPVRPEAGAASESAPAARRGFRARLRSVRRSDGSRAYSLGALIASALAGVIVGGIGVATVHAVTDDGPGDRGDRGAWMQQRGGPGFGRDGTGGGTRGGPPGGPGQVVPSTPPEEEGSNS